MTVASYFIRPNEHGFPQFTQAVYSTGHNVNGSAYPEYHFDQQFESGLGPIHPYRQEHAHHVQLLQQHAMAQCDQAMYYQYVLAQEQQRQHIQQLAAEQQPPVSPRKSYRVQTRAERRAEHNAVERARRDILNSKLQELANSLPNLQNDSRPSKGTIIERTIDYVKKVMEKEKDYRLQIHELSQQNKQLEEHLLTNSVDPNDSRRDSLTGQSSCPSLAESYRSVSPTPGSIASPSFMKYDAPSFFETDGIEVFDSSTSVHMDEYLFHSLPNNDDETSYHTASMTQNKDSQHLRDTFMTEERALL